MTVRERQEKPAVAGTIKPEVNEHYAKAARRYTAAGIVFLALFLCFLVLLLVFGSEYITSENLGYLARDFGTAADGSAESFDKIVYNGTAETKFASFRGGLATVSQESYRYYDRNGLTVVSDPLGYAFPVPVAGDKYMLLYDLGGTGWSVYNQLTRIVSRQADDVIIAGDIASDGSMVLVTRSRDTKYVVELYNPAFNQVMRSYKDSYVVSAAISSDGKEFLVVSASPSSTDFDCEVEICRRGEDSPIRRDLFSHEMPLLARRAGDGFVILSDSAVHYYDGQGSHKKTIQLSGMTLEYADIRDGRVALVGAVNALGSVYRVTIYDADGTTLHDGELRQRISGIRMGKNPENALCYLWTPDAALRIRPDHGAEMEAVRDGEILDVLPLESGALLCQKTAATPLFADLKD